MPGNILFIFCVCISFVAGYVVGRVERLFQLLENPTDKPRSFLKDVTAPPVKTNIEIDDAKYVAPINTAGLSKTNFDTTLGKTTKTRDDIQASVSKLAQLKGK